MLSGAPSLNNRIITTSWDDGNIADFKLADLLNKYKLPGTFYIPFANTEHSVMDENQIKEIADGFEVGGHTINHVRINSTSRQLFDNEIGACYNRLSDLLGKPPVTFCFPGGVYNNSAVKYALEKGFKLVRTTELLNCELPNSLVVPTTVQLFPHTALHTLNIPV